MSVLFINVPDLTIRIGDRTTDLSPREMDLLLCLASNPGHITPQVQIWNQVWQGHRTKTKTLQVYIWYLRLKLSQVCDWPLITTISGEGYTLELGPPQVRISQASVLQHHCCPSCHQPLVLADSRAQ